MKATIFFGAFCSFVYCDDTRVGGHAARHSSNLKELLGAIHFGGRVKIIETQGALKLIDRYFKNIDK
jgi:hypothetical protein